jgi:hypothetical protein
MKIKTGRHNVLAVNKFDVKAVRELLVGESKFITQLLDKVNLPVPANNESGMNFQHHFLFHLASHEVNVLSYKSSVNQ